MSIREKTITMFYVEGENITQEEREEALRKILPEPLPRYCYNCETAFAYPNGRCLECGGCPLCGGSAPVEAVLSLPKEK